MEAAMVLASSTRVEISGWDAENRFFVEKASLQGESGKQVQARMQHRAKPGTLLFVRPMDIPKQGDAWPMAFRVVRAEWNEKELLNEVELKAVEVQH